jgi:uncharacterized protein YjlB
MFQPTQNFIAELELKLRSFHGDLNAICNYYFENGFAGCVVYNDKADEVFDWHMHKSDNYLYLLQGEMVVENNSSEKVNLQAGDFFYLPAFVLHKATIGSNGAKYVVATPDGDFSSTKGEMKV